MALVLLDRAKETTTVVGTGTATLLGAVTSYQSLAGVGNGNTTYYCIVDQVGANWEVGIGTYTSAGTTLARTTVLASSNAGALVVFTTGVKDVFVTYPSEKGVWYDASGNVLFTGTTTATNLTYTGTLTGSTGILNIGSGQIYKDASGNVGIGTTTSLSRLTALGTTSTVSNGASTRNPIASIRGGNDNNRLDFYVDNSGATAIMGLGAYNTAGAGTAMAFYTGASAFESMRIDSSGNVGIGTSSPAYKLHVVSSADRPLVITTGTDTPAVFQSTTANSYIQLKGTGPDVYFGNVGGAATITAGTERMRIDSLGNLLVGTASPAPSCQNTIVGASQAGLLSLAVIHNASTNAVRGIITRCPNFNGNDGYLFIGARSGGDVSYMYTNGNWVNINGSYGTLSDIKLKENIVDATGKLADVMKLRVCNFNLKKQPNEKQIGFIAQEFEQIFPGLVEESPDLTEGGQTTGSKTKSIKVSVLTPILVKAIQEQQTLIEALTARLTALEAK